MAIRSRSCSRSRRPSGSRACSRRPSADDYHPLSLLPTIDRETAGWLCLHLGVSQDVLKQDESVQQVGAASACGAAKVGDTALLRKLVLEGNVDVNASDYDSRTALHVAASEGHLKMVTCLIKEFKADTNPVDRWGGTPLDDAIRQKHGEVEAYLRSNGGLGGQWKGSGDPAADLCDAAAKGDLDHLRRIVLDHKIDVGLGDYDHRTALHLAASQGRLDVVICLIEELTANASPVDRWGGTPLDDAVRHEHLEVEAYLLAHGGSFGKWRSTGDPAADLCGAAASGNLRLLRRLVKDHGLNAGLGDYDHRTALHLAASSGLLDVVTCLILELKADPNPIDRWGGTPLDDALRHEHEDVQAYLVKNGGHHGSWQSSGDPAADLCGAAAKGNLRLLRRLVQDHGINVGLGDYDHRTALHLAASSGHLTVVTCLIEELKADPNPVDRWGNTPLDDALRSRHDQIAKVLRDNGGKGKKSHGRPISTLLRCFKCCSRRKSRAQIMDSSLTSVTPIAPSNLTVSIKQVVPAERVLASGLELALLTIQRDKWQNDCIALDTVTQGHAMHLVARQLWDLHDLFNTCTISTNTFTNFVLAVQSTYGNNPYHNRTHGVDVLLTVHLFLSSFNFTCTLTKPQLHAALLAAMVHDFNHPGTTNAHETQAWSQLSVLHSDLSVLEKHHLASAFSLLRQDNYNILRQFSKEDLSNIREIVIEMVLSTDMKEHMSFVSQLEKIPKTRDTNPEFDSESDWRFDTKLLLCTCLKFADLGHTTKSWKLHHMWSLCMREEFFALGDREKELGMPKSPLCDRDAPGSLAKSQCGFFKFVIIPFYSAVADLIDPRMAPIMELQANYSGWQREADRDGSTGK